MLKSLLLLFIWALILSMSSPSSSSLAHRHERSVRGARNAAMESPYASPRRHRLAANPFQDVGNLPRVTLPRLPSLDQERAALRDADRERQQALQETPSRRYRRVPRREEENRAVSPTPGLRRAVPPSGLATPPDSQAPPAVANKRALAQRARRDRENAAKTAAAAGPSTSTGAPAAAPGASFHVIYVYRRHVSLAHLHQMILHLHLVEGEVGVGVEVEGKVEGKENELVSHEYSIQDFSSV
ncbi:hypothetical protein B0H13DRAFT_1862933 [Mycena leptocephala]|nr:hypothetical protein B0H13DRAFT_1862933 [Mycena leptocephala]